MPTRDALPAGGQFLPAFRNLERHENEIPPGSRLEARWGDFRITVDGEDTNGFAECGFLWAAGQATFAGATLIRAQWAITAKHVLTTPGHYHLSIPVYSGIDIEPGNTYELTPKCHPSLDLALVKLDRGPNVMPAQTATQAEFAAATSVQLCAFGPDPDRPNSRHKKVTLPCEIERTLPSSFNLDPEYHFVVKNAANLALVVPTDSGGAAYINVEGQFKLAGVIFAQVAAEPRRAMCIALSTLGAWIEAEAA